MAELSILIPSRNEQFLNNTITDILTHSEADTEVIVALDGAWPLESIEDDPRVTVLYHPKSIGQRAATNDAARVASGKYLMKCDAHCSFGQGFDRILLEDITGHPLWTIIPMMFNLHAFDWVCSCGWRKYQGPTPDACPDCGLPVHKEMVWQPRKSPCTTAMRFDRNLKFQYWSGYKKRQIDPHRITMSCLGACWMLSADRYWDLNICDEAHGSWGQQGTEVACKTWLSGGELIVTTNTWFAHMFRTQGGDFGFPYHLSGRDVDKARKYSRELWNADHPDQLPHWPPAIHPLSWLIEKFSPVPEWTDD